MDRGGDRYNKDRDIDRREGRCFNCGEKGHISYQCNNKKINNNIQECFKKEKDIGEKIIKLNDIDKFVSRLLIILKID